VDRSLQHAILVSDIAPTMQSALDNWAYIKANLEERYAELCNGKAKNQFAFQGLPLLSPLPRAYQWADGSAYVNHVELVRRARGAEMPDNFWHDPLIYQGGSDTFLGPYDSIPLQDPTYGMDFESEIAVIVTDVPLGANQSQAQNSICLIMLANDISLRNLIPGELGKGFGFFQSKPSSAFSPLAVTPDELGDAWDGKKLSLPLHSYLNGTLFGKPNAGVDMTFDFPTLIQHAAKTRKLSAGSIIGSGTVSNYNRSLGSSCIAEKRMLELLDGGKACTPYLKAGDRVRIEMLDRNDVTIFGAIDQTVVEIQVLETVC
jgi:fumarylacetoacetate (FAA) hydrolase